MTLIVSWNVNSVKSRLSHLEQLIRTYSPDIILLQEIKCETDRFPKLELEDMGYNVAVWGQKSYNGVAILSRSMVEDVTIDLISEDEFKNEARYIEAFTSIDGLNLRVSSVYVPQGTELSSERFNFKLRFYQYLNQRYQTLINQNEIIISGGDFNVAPENIDVYNPQKLEGTLGFHMDERKLYRSILNQGMVDSYRIMQPKTHEYSWWDYRKNGWSYNKGMRIDSILLSANAVDHLESSGIYTQTRGWDKPSDHAPTFCKLAKKT